MCRAFCLAEINFVKLIYWSNMLVLCVYQLSTLNLIYWNGKEWVRGNRHSMLMFLTQKEILHCLKFLNSEWKTLITSTITSSTIVLILIGLIPRCAAELFKLIDTHHQDPTVPWKYKVLFSYLEIYQEKVGKIY